MCVFVSKYFPCCMAIFGKAGQVVVCNPEIGLSDVVNTSTQNHQVNTHPACTAVSPQGSTEQRSNGAFHFEFCRLQNFES